MSLFSVLLGPLFHVACDFDVSFIIQEKKNLKNLTSCMPLFKLLIIYIYIYILYYNNKIDHLN